MEREIVLDTETTGLSPERGDRIIEIGALELRNKILTGKKFHVYINPERDVPYAAFKIHGISSEFLQDKPKFHEVAKDFCEFIQDSKLIIHNAKFDMKFLNHELTLIKQPSLDMGNVIDTLMIARRKFPGSPASLDALCKRFKVDNSGRDYHGALIDSYLLSEVYVELMGGRQEKFDFKAVEKAKEQLAEKVDNSIKKLEASFRSRVVAPTEEEEKRHTELLKKIKEPIW